MLFRIVFLAFLLTIAAGATTNAPPANTREIQKHLWDVSGFAGIGLDCYNELCGKPHRIQDFETFTGWNEAAQNCPENLIKERKGNKITQKELIDNEYRGCKTREVNMRIEHRVTALRRLINSLPDGKVELNKIVLSTINSETGLNKLARSIADHNPELDITKLKVN